MTDQQRLAAARRHYAEQITAELGDGRLEEAFAAVPRERFLGAGPWLALVENGYVETPSADPIELYEDKLFALIADRGLNNGAPGLHARCLAAVAPLPGERVLQVGCGTGYYTAILAHLVGRTGTVLGLDVEPRLVEIAGTNLGDWPQATVAARSGTVPPLPESDVIYVCAGASAPLGAWLDVLAPGGRLIFPLTADDWSGAMLRIERQAGGMSARLVTEAGFIPCIGGRNENNEQRLRAALGRGDWPSVRALRRDPENIDETCWLAGSDWWLSTAAPA